MNKLLLGLLVLLTITAGGGVYYLQTEYAGIGLPWVDSVDLPDFPQLPEPQSTLNEGQSGDIYFATKSPYTMSELLNDYDAAIEHTGMGALYLPPGASTENPVPLVIILHGSGGIVEEREPTYARLFNQWGVAGFVLDYYSVRGVTPDTKYLYKTLSASEVDILVDAYSALKVLGTHPAIDATRIGVTGYSYGGMATRYLLDSRIKAIVAPDVPPFALHMDIYGPCHQDLGGSETTGAPYLAIHGDQDNSVDVALCAKVREQIAADGSVVDSLVIAGAGHAWENPKPRKLYPSPYISGCTFSSQPGTGRSMINGELLPAMPDDASREQHAFNRTNIRIYAPQCVREGYIIGWDQQSDTVAKAKMHEFMVRHFGL